MRTWQQFTKLTMALGLQVDLSDEHSAAKQRRKAILRWRDSARVAGMIAMMSDDLGAQRASSFLRRAMAQWRGDTGLKSKLTSDRGARAGAPL